MTQSDKTGIIDAPPLNNEPKEARTRPVEGKSKKASARKSVKKKVAKRTSKKSTPKRAVAKKPAAKNTLAKKPAPMPGTTMTEALGETFLVDLITDWQEHGGGVIETCRTTKPDAYLKLVATYAPKEFRKTLEPFEGMSDNDLKARLNETLEEIRTLGLDVGA